MGQLDLTTAQIQSILDNAEFGMEFTGGFSGKPLSNSYAWEAGVGINITQADVDAGRFKTFSLDRDVHLAVDAPYWGSPVPADHTDKGIFGGSWFMVTTGNNLTRLHGPRFCTQHSCSTYCMDQA